MSSNVRKIMKEKLVPLVCAITSLNFSNAKIETTHARMNIPFIWNVEVALHPAAKLASAINIKGFRNAQMKKLQNVSFQK